MCIQKTLNSESKVVVDENCLIDLHLHLDGSISVKSARELAKMSNVILPEDDACLRNMLSCPEDCKDLNDYLSRFDLPGRLMQTKETIEQSAYHLCEELQTGGLIYAEIRFAPQKHCEKGLTQDEVVQAAICGIEKSDFHAQLILCCMRDGSDNSKENMETVHLTKKYLGKGVCACDLAGAESLFPNELYSYVFEEANKRSVPFTVHSGEASGPESIKYAISHGANRIGHGVRSIEDYGIVNQLVEKKIAIEVCPTSNINTCVFPSMSQMPIKTLMDMGVMVTINSDNMSVSNTDVRKELQLVADAFHLTKEDVKQLLLNAAQNAFVDETTKAELKEKIICEFRKTGY